MSSSMRTASLGGSAPELMKRRTLVYDARSTSAENVESGAEATERNRLSSMRAYSSVLKRSRRSAGELVPAAVSELLTENPGEAADEPRNRIPSGAAVTTTSSSLAADRVKRKSTVTVSPLMATELVAW